MYCKVVKGTENSAILVFCYLLLSRPLISQACVIVCFLFANLTHFISLFIKESKY